MAEEKFEEEKFMKILVNLKDTQESIQGFSGWCIRNRKSAYKMARCWIKVIKKVRVEQKLVLFYLVNDIVQHSAKRGYSELLEKFRSAIKEAIPHLKDEKIGPKVQRCLDIWEERDIFDKNYLQDLSGLIDLTPVKEDQEVVDNFQPPQLCTQIKILKALEDDADYKLKNMKENELDIQNIEEMKLKLKDKHCGAEFVQEFEDGTKRMEQYIKAMEREIRKRRQVIEMLGQGKKYYESVFGEAEIVATAYNNFGNRVTKVKSKLTEKIPELANAGVIDDSPVPSPDYDAPSPEGSGDEMEIKLPDEGGGGEDSKKVTNDLNSRLSGINYDSFQTPNKEGGGGYSISEFLTKMAHGEDVDVDSFISGGNQSERKRKHVSGSGYDPSTGGMFDTPQPRARDPWSDTRDTPSQPPVPDLLAWQDEDHEVENLALARLKQAANKNNKNNTDNGVHSSNLVNLTGSPGVKLRKLSGGGGSRSDMDVSDDDHSDLRDSFLDSSFPPPVRDSWDAPAPVRDAWDTPSPVQGVSPWENGHAPTQPPPPTDDRFSAPPPVFPHPPGQNPGFNNGNHDRSNPPPFSTSRGPDHSNPPPFSSSGGPDHSNPPPFSTSGGTDHGIPPPFHSSRPPPVRHDQPEGSSHFQGFDSQDSGLGRGNFRPNRGFGHRGNDNHSPRFPGAPGSRFPGPQGPPGHQRGGGGGGFQSDRFSDSDSQDGERGGMRGGRGSFRGGNFHKDFDKGSHRGGFDRGRGGGSRGWNGARRPWNNRGGGGGGRGGGRGGNW